MVQSIWKFGRDHMVVRFTTTYAISAYHTNAVSSNPAHGKVHSIQHNVIKFVSLTRGKSMVFSWYSGFLHQ